MKLKKGKMKEKKYIKYLILIYIFNINHSKNNFLFIKSSLNKMT